jgi:hypothetical protein
MKNIGKPCTGKPYARFDEGGQEFLLSTLPKSLFDECPLLTIPFQSPLRCSFFGAKGIEGETAVL